MESSTTVVAVVVVGVAVVVVVAVVAVASDSDSSADFDTYIATFCTSTGLPAHVELAPVTFYQDQYQNMNDESQGPVV